MQSGSVVIIYIYGNQISFIDTEMGCVRHEFRKETLNLMHLLKSEDMFIH